MPKRQRASNSSGEASANSRSSNEESANSGSSNEEYNNTSSGKPAPKPAPRGRAPRGGAAKAAPRARAPRGGKSKPAATTAPRATLGGRTRKPPANRPTASGAPRAVTPGATYGLSNAMVQKLYAACVGVGCRTPKTMRANINNRASSNPSGKRKVISELKQQILLRSLQAMKEAAQHAEAQGLANPDELIEEALAAATRSPQDIEADYQRARNLIKDTDPKSPWLKDFAIKMVKLVTPDVVGKAVFAGLVGPKQVSAVAVTGGAAGAMYNATAAIGSAAINQGRDFGKTHNIAFGAQNMLTFGSIYAAITTLKYWIRGFPDTIIYTFVAVVESIVETKWWQNPTYKVSGHIYGTVFRALMIMSMEWGKSAILRGFAARGYQFGKNVLSDTLHGAIGAGEYAWWTLKQIFGVGLPRGVQAMRSMWGRMETDFLARPANYALRRMYHRGPTYVKGNVRRMLTLMRVLKENWMSFILKAPNTPEFWVALISVLGAAGAVWVFCVGSRHVYRRVAGKRSSRSRNAMATPTNLPPEKKMRT